MWVGGGVVLNVTSVVGLKAGGSSMAYAVSMVNDLTMLPHRLT
jgi:hypothetical protein